MASHGSVCGFRFEGLSIRGDKNRGHEAEGAKALGNDVGLDVSVVVCLLLVFTVSHGSGVPAYSSMP